MGNVTLTL